MNEQLNTDSNNKTFFTSKEHYVAFRTAWRDFINSGKHKRKTYIDSQGGVCKLSSNLYAEHHLLYNLLRKRDVTKAFSPAISKSKIEYYSRFTNPPEYYALITAKNSIKHYVAYHEKGFTNKMEYLLEPFNGTVTPDMVAKAWHHYIS